MTQQTKQAPAPLCGPDDPPAYKLLNPDGKAPFIILCDHGGTAIPQKLGMLGLPPALFETHHDIHDIGTRAVALKMADLIDAPTLIAHYSRLLIDVNRRLDHPTSIVTGIEGHSVPGNFDLTEEERSARREAVFTPYHDRVTALVDRFESQEIMPTILSLHSFTRYFYKQVRPWDAGILWVQDFRLPSFLLSFLAEKGLRIGNNEPYDARILRGTTTNHHADARRLPNALVEICNDQIADQAGVERWAGYLVDSLQKALAEGVLDGYYDGPDLVHNPGQDRAYIQALRAKAEQGD
ncbi:MAG: N-formylglutamate amidohydrolase [Alphaproteobacteria bacterium]|nr:N-formylglutamate amidohydrolase [Alphaproteobacteria bacterium]